MPFSDANTVGAMLTSFNGPNFHGVLHKFSPEETPFKTLITGAQGGPNQSAVIVGAMASNHREFEWQFYDLRNPSATRQRIDGAKNISAEHRRRFNIKNVVQTHTETIDVAFEKAAQTGQFDGINVAQGANPVTDEVGWQELQTYKEINLDQEVSLLYASYHLPSDNQTASRTRGIDEAITTNVVDGDGGKLTWALLVSAMKSAVQEAGKMIGEGLVVMLNTDQLEQISAEFEAKNLAPRDRTVYGVDVQTVVTPFGPCNLLYNRHVNQGQVIGVNPTALRLWHRWVLPQDDIPGGVTFTYRLARTGNAHEKAMYSSVGLEYGLEKFHFKINDLETSEVS